MRYGLIGKTLAHSFSPDYFAEKFAALGITDATYSSFELTSISEFPALVERYADLKGVNVTIPYKQEIIPFLDELDTAARELGAVNTVTFDRRSGEFHLKGYNTDVIGFKRSIAPLLTSADTKALVLGTGGSSLAVCYALKRLGFSVQSVSRTAKEGVWDYRSLTAERIKEFSVVVNTTPQGMFPHTATAPEIPYKALNKKHLLFDLIYNPEETLFLKRGKEQGCRVKNGLEMLHLQAEASWEIWNRG